MKKQLWHAVIYLFLNVSLILLLNDCPSEVRGKAFLNSLRMWVMLTITKLFIMLFLFCHWQWEQGTPWQFSKQISKFSIQLSFHIYILFLPKLKTEIRSFLERCKKDDQIVRLSSKVPGCHKI